MTRLTVSMLNFDIFLKNILLAGLGWEDSQRIKAAQSYFYQGWKVHFRDPGEFLK